MTNSTSTLAALPTGQSPAPTRLSSIDMLRGLVMVIMALDHTRDYFAGVTFDPTDLARTNAMWFFTRWITHFCAPVFVFLAGTGAFLSLRKSGPQRLSVFLLKRGLWLVFLEIAVISPIGWSFRLDGSFTRLQVIWAIGVSMVVLAALIRLFSSRIIAAIGAALILVHNLFDGPHAALGLTNPLGPFAGAWKALHGFMFLEPAPHKVVASLYPLIPWVGVLALGYGVGEIFLLEPPRRSRATTMPKPSP